MEQTRTGRALKLDGLENAINKVTLGFKCDAGTKIQLVEEAVQRGMTLSQYVDTLISTRHMRTKATNKSEIELKFERAKLEIVNYANALDFYEKNQILQKLLSSNLGKQLSYNDSFGNLVNIKIQSVADVFTVLVNSFKIN